VKIIVVYHDYHGCDTGCCGHTVKVLDGPIASPEEAEDTDGEEAFNFEHPNDGETPVAFARRMIEEQFPAEHIADLDWDNCHIVDFNKCC